MYEKEIKDILYKSNIFKFEFITINNSIIVSIYGNISNQLTFKNVGGKFELDSGRFPSIQFYDGPFENSFDAVYKEINLIENSVKELIEEFNNIL